MRNISFFSKVSSVQLKWQFAEMPKMPARYFLEEFEGYSLEGRILSAPGKEKEVPEVFVIHGARSDYTKLNAILYPLQNVGISSLGFNLSGHNATTDVRLEHTSLACNLKESLRFATHLGNKMRTVVGHSMGGALALKVAQEYQSSVKKIVLICPAMYADVAYDKPFGHSFKSINSVPFNFLNSSSLKFLRQFDGELMLIIGEYDGLKSVDHGGKEGAAAGMVKIFDDQMGASLMNSVIPFEVLDAIAGSLPSSRLKKIVLPECDHAVSAWLRAKPTLARSLACEIAEFIARPVSTLLN